MKNNIPTTIHRALACVTIVALTSIAAHHEARGATMYTDTNSTGTWGSARWSTAANGPFTSAWSGGSDAWFLTNGNYNFDGSTNTISIGNVTVESNSTVKSTNSTAVLSTGGNVRTFTVQTNAVLDFGTHTASSSAGVGFIKDGSGILAWSGGQFSSGFTLNSGTLVMRGANAMGQGTTNILTLNGGTLAVLTDSNSLTLAAGKYGGGIFIKGDIQLGALSNAYATNQQYLISDNASLTFAGSASLEGSMRTLTIGGNGDYTFTGVLSNGGLTVNAASGATGNLILSGTNTYAGGTVINGGTLQLGIGTGSGTVVGDITNNATLAINRTGSQSLTNVISGTGALKQIGSGSITLTANNTFTGATTVSAGTLKLNATTGSALGGTTNVSVASGATLLLSKNEQVNNSATVSLSGGTIKRDSGVSETFSDLSLSAASFIDFGAAHGPTDLGTLTFGTYTPSSLLTVSNFFEGNVLVFKSDLSSTIHGALFSFDNGFTSSWDSGSSTFTITAIPEPSAYLALAALIGLMLWPMRKRLRASRCGE